MNRESKTYQTYVEILRRELICAMGCTEPIAIAFCAAKARSILGRVAMHDTNAEIIRMMVK